MANQNLENNSQKSKQGSVSLNDNMKISREQHMLKACISVNENIVKKEETVQQANYGGYYYGYGYGYGYGYPSTKKEVSVTEHDVKITVPSDKNIIFDTNNCKDFKREGDILSFTLSDKPVPVLIGSTKNEVYAVGQIEKDGKLTVLDRNSEEAKQLLKAYDERIVNLAGGKENTRYFNQFIELERGEGNAINQIVYRGLACGNDIIIYKNKNGRYMCVGEGPDGKLKTYICENLKLYKNGKIEFTIVHATNEGKELKELHTIHEKEHTHKIVRTFLLDAKVQAQEYSGFSNNNAQDAKAIGENGELGKVTRGIGVTTGQQEEDAIWTFKKAMQDEEVPVFYTSSHGAPNFNQAVGNVSNWINRVNDARMKAGYDGPVMIEIQNCHSGLVAAELEAFAKFPQGSIIMTSQDSNYSYYNPNISQSADGATVDEAKRANVMFSVAYFGGKTIVESNNPTVAVVGKDSKIHLFSKNNQYFVGGIKSLGLIERINSNNKELPEFDERKIKASLKASGCGDADIKNYLRNSTVQFFSRCLLFASQQTDMFASESVNYSDGEKSTTMSCFQSGEEEMRLASQSLEVMGEKTIS